MWRRVELTRTVLFACNVSTELATACSCIPPPPPPLGPAGPQLPNLEGKNSAVFLGTVQDVSPKSQADHEILWRKMYREDLSEDRPPSVQKMRTFMLHFWRDTFSPAEKERIMKAKSVDDLESALGTFWTTPRRVRFRVNELRKIDQFVLYTGLGNGDCGVEFKAGEKWLVDAYRDEAGRWIARICSVTIREPQAAAALNAIRFRIRNTLK